MLRPAGSVEQQFRLGIKPRIRRIEQDPSRLIADRGTTWLPGERYGLAMCGEVIREQKDLGGLAGAFNSFEGYEGTPHLVELQDHITRRPQRRVRREKEHLNFCAERAQDLAGNLLPCRIETSKRIVEDE